jgi:hypothetical protein
MDRKNENGVQVMIEIRWKELPRTAKKKNKEDEDFNCSKMLTGSSEILFFEKKSAGNLLGETDL